MASGPSPNYQKIAVKMTEKILNPAVAWASEAKAEAGNRPLSKG